MNNCQNHSLAKFEKRIQRYGLSETEVSQILDSAKSQFEDLERQGHTVCRLGITIEVNLSDELSRRFRVYYFRNCTMDSFEIEGFTSLKSFYQEIPYHLLYPKHLL